MTVDHSSSGGVTAIVVSYNHEHFVQECLRSILEQTRPVDELIFVDDASKDESAALARAILADSSIDHQVLVHHVNQGLCRGLNSALALVKTEFYFYISADDVMGKNRLAMQLPQLLGRPHVAASYSDAWRIDSHGERLGASFSQHYGWPSPAELRGRIGSRLIIDNWIPAPSVLLRTSAVRSVGGYDEDLFYEDYDLWLRLAQQFDFDVVDAALVSHRVLDHSLGSQEFNPTNPRFLRALMQTYAKHVADAELGTMASDQLWTHARRLWSVGGSRDEVARAMWQSRRGTLGRLRFYGFLAAVLSGLPGRLYPPRVSR